MSSKLSMRVATHALIAGLAITSGGIGAVTLAAPAVAAPADQAINLDAKGSLTIHKRESDDPGSWVSPADGEEIKAPKTAPGAALSGAKFTIQKIDLDFSDPANIKKAAKLTPAEAEKLLTGTPTEKTTKGDEGVAKFSDLAVGAYLVKEIEAPAGKVPIKDFIAFVPMTNAAGTGWNYDVHAYPKNTTAVTVSKKFSSVLPEGGEAGEKQNGEANVGDQISFDIESTRPVLNKNKSFVRFFRLYDVVPAGLKYVNEADKRKMTIGTTVLTEGTDFEVTEETVDDQKYVFYTLTKAGNEILTNAADTAKVIGTFTFDVEAVPTDDKGRTSTNKGGAITDVDAKTIDPDNPNDPGTTPDYPEPTDPATPPPAQPNPDPKNPNPDDPNTPGTGVEASWVTVDFKKKNDENKGLTGAEFNVYRCTKTGAETGLNKGDKKAVLGDQVLTKQGKNSDGVFVSGDDGKVTVNALRVRDDAVRGTDGGYCLVETKAPNGYELLPSPYFFRVSKDDVKRTKEFNFEVENTRSVGPKLPATGGMGVGILVAFGALIVGAGAFFARRNGKARG